MTWKKLLIQSSSPSFWRDCLTSALTKNVHRRSKFCTPGSACILPLCSGTRGATGVHTVANAILSGYGPPVKTAAVTLHWCIRWRRWHSHVSLFYNNTWSTNLKVHQRQLPEIEHLQVWDRLSEQTKKASGLANVAFPQVVKQYVQDTSGSRICLPHLHHTLDHCPSVIKGMKNLVRVITYPDHSPR